MSHVETRAPAQVAASIAEKRADVARDASDAAKQAARDARRAASEAKAEADDLRDVADPEKRERESLSPDQAKQRLMEAVRAFDPLKPAREHPWVLIGAAAVSGMVLGSSASALGGVAKVTSALVKLAKPLAGVAAQIAAAKVAASQTAESVVADAPASPNADRSV